LVSLFRGTHTAYHTKIGVISAALSFISEVSALTARRELSFNNEKRELSSNSEKRKLSFNSEIQVSRKGEELLNGGVVEGESCGTCSGKP
jgi:hypothetical protein